MIRASARPSRSGRYEQGVLPEAAIGRLAASLALVPEGSCLSAQELLQHCQLGTLRQQLSKA